MDHAAERRGSLGPGAVITQQKYEGGHRPTPLRDAGVLKEGHGIDRSIACIGRGAGMASGRGRASDAETVFAPGGPTLSGPGEIPVGLRFFA